MKKNRRLTATAILMSLLLISGQAANPAKADLNIEALAKDGKSALEKVDQLPNDGNDHLKNPEQIKFKSPYPTSGGHDSRQLPPGVYGAPQSPARLVHSLEHGNIVIYFGKINPNDVKFAVLAAGRYQGGWDGIIFTPDPDLGQKIVLTAWQKRLTLDTFEQPAIAAFIDAYRGRGPENRVR